MKRILDFFIKNWLIKIFIAFVFGLGTLLVNTLLYQLPPYINIMTFLGFGYILLVILVGLANAVNNMIQDGLKTYKRIKIKKGNHYPSIFSMVRLPIFYCFKSKYRMERFFKFTDESVFEFAGDDKYDYSKLFGFSLGHHQKNSSFRFGFRFIDDKLYLAAYYYINGLRHIFDDTSVNFKLNQTYKLSITYTKEYNSIMFNILDVSSGELLLNHRVSDEKINSKKWGYKLGIYIGGNKPAPKDIVLLRKRK